MTTRRRSTKTDPEETQSYTSPSHQHAETRGVNVGRDAGDIHTGDEFHVPGRALVVVAVLVGVALVSAAVLPPLFTYVTGREVSNAEQVRTCMDQHQMNSARDKREVETAGDTYLGEEVYRRTTFRFCDWPRPGYAEADGYSQIEVIVTPGPGDSEATDATNLDRILTTCPAISVTYQFGLQGSSEFVGPYTLRPGDVVEPFTGKAWVPQAPADGEEPMVVYPYPQSEEVIVVRNDHIVLDKASCELSTASPRPYGAGSS